MSLRSPSSTSTPQEAATKNQLVLFLQSGIFTTSIAVLIILNALYVAIDESFRNDGDQYSTWWLVFESILTLVFLSEFLLKCHSIRCKYFKDAWNIFDFSSVRLGIIGFLLSCQMIADGGSDKR